MQRRLLVYNGRRSNIAQVQSHKFMAYERQSNKSRESLIPFLQDEWTTKDHLLLLQMKIELCRSIPIINRRFSCSIARTNWRKYFVGDLEFDLSS